jgi:uncharacterized protein
MLPELETLLIIQDRDQKIFALKKELARIPEMAEHAKTRLRGDQDTVQKTKEQLQHVEVEMKKVELDIGTRENTIARLKRQQYETRKNDEFQALGHEVVRYQGEVAKLEETQLVYMERSETMHKALREVEAALSKTQAVVEADLRELEERRRNSEEQIRSLEAEKEPFVRQVDRALYGTYQRILKSKGGSAVVPVLGGQCRGCHMKVTSATIVKAKTEKDMTFCDHCGRMIYFDE